MQIYKNMETQKILLIIIIAVIVVAGWVLLQQPNGIISKIFSYFSNLNKPSSEGIILFYGDGCPHCENVDRFIADNNVKKKVSFTELEIFNNENNQKVWLDKVNSCKLNPSEVGAPFLWDGQGCLMGDVDIIKYFQDKIDSLVTQ